MAITPVTPIPLEQMVPVTTGILFDADEAIVSVTVDAVLVWNGTPQNGWTGLTINHPGGVRYVLDPPSAFTVGSLVSVVITGSPTVLAFSFAIGLRQITTTDDASSPRVTEGGPPAPAMPPPLWHLPFDDAAGPPIDAQGNYTFVELGSPVWQQPGVIDNAVRLGGVADAVATFTPGAPPLPDPLKRQKFTFAGWINPNGVGAQRTIISSGRSANRGWKLSMLATNVLEFRAFNGLSSSPATSLTFLVPSTWFHVAVVVDAALNSQRLYVNSNREFSGTLGVGFGSIVYDLSAGMYLGQDPIAAPDAWQGLLDDWRYYNDEALTDAQVSVLFQLSTGPLRTPWVLYSRLPGNIYARKDEPLTAEVLLVPGSSVDVGYSEETNDIEILYIQNGKVFLVTGQASEDPSTLTQPSVLKTGLKAGFTGESPDARHIAVTFPPIKFATPPDGPIVSGFTGDSPFFTFSSPPNSPAPVAFLGTPTAAIVPPVSSTLITAVRLFKINTGAAVQVAELPYSTEIQVFFDPAYVEGDRYYTQSVYGDQGASAMRRLTAISAAAAATNGDFLRSGVTGESPQHTYSTITFTPLKLAVPTDGPLVGGDMGHTGEAGFTRTWFPSTGSAAAMSAAVGGYLVFTGLVQMSRQHLDRQVTVSGAATAANNGSWTIVEIISPTSVRVVALTAPGADANNGALVWSVTGADSVAPASFVARNTLNIGAGS